MAKKSSGKATRLFVLARAWSWHSVERSIDFPAGAALELTAEQEAAARAAGVIKEADDGDQGDTAAG